MEKVANVTQYADGLKIDFTLWPVELMRKIVQAPALTAELDAGYRILMDKDGLTEGMKLPTYTAYIPVPPTAEAYQKWIEDFFSDAPYVAKCLRRGELLPVKWALDYDMKHVYLRPMLEWHVEVEHGWSMPVGSLGKGLKKHLPSAIWSQLESSYAGADVADNWEALFRTMGLFRQVAIEVGEALGYAYPYDLDKQVTLYVQAMRR
jgi:aminoglycoside 6-adenylyltransferase